MNNHSSELLSLGENTGLYAPANFPDASDTTPYEFSNSVDAPYSIAIANSITKHYSELKEKHPVHIIEGQWKRKFREFLVTKNNKILEFLTCKLKNHPVLGPSEHFFQKFGKSSVNFNTQTIKDIVYDLSGQNGLDEYDALSISKGFLSLEKYAMQTKDILDRYKECVDAILKSESKLKSKLEILDVVHTKLNGFSNISVNENYNPMMESIEKYLTQVFEDCKIEEDYNELIEHYRKFMYLRDIIRVIRSKESCEKEPLCNICFEDTISFAFVPCGHTYCSKCVKRQLSTCAVCRTQVRDRVRLYFS